LRWHQRFSARGSLKRLDLLDLVRLECKSGNSRMFEVFVGNLRGEIYIKEGVIVHAIMPDRRGQSAFTFLATEPKSVFYLRQFVEPDERSIDRQWEFLVMEAAQVAEQLAATAKPVEPPSLLLHPAVPPPPPEIVQPPEFSVPPPPAPPPPSRRAPRPEPSVTAPIPMPARVSQPAPTPLEVQAEAVLRITEAPDARPMETETDPAGFKVEEMLLCADFREVLFESRCHDPAKRLGVGETLLQKANDLALTLPLGELERVECHCSGSRLILRYEAKRCLLVRTNTKSRPPQADSSAAESAEAWLERQPVLRGLLAAVVLTPDGRVQAKSFVPDFPQAVLQSAGREAGRLLDVAMKFTVPAWQVRLIFSRTQLYVLRRPDGVVLCGFLLREGTDVPGLAMFFDGFQSVRNG
jgi:hypothetical protein